GEFADVAACLSTTGVRFVAVDEQFHVERLHVPGHELEEGAAEAGHRHLGKVVRPLDGVLVGVEEDRRAGARNGVGDGRLFESHHDLPMRSRCAWMRWPICCMTRSVMRSMATGSASKAAGAGAVTERRCVATGGSHGGMAGAWSLEAGPAADESGPPRWTTRATGGARGASARRSSEA